MSIFPFIDASTTAEKAEDLPMLREYAYDYEKNELLLDEHGKTYMVEGNEALKIWIFKALTTSRYHYTAYSFAFGEEWEDQLVGRTMDGDILKLELERFIVEALMVNPYIKRLDNFVYENNQTGLTVTFDVSSIYGTDKIPFSPKEVRL